MSILTSCTLTILVFVLLFSGVVCINKAAKDPKCTDYFGLTSKWGCGAWFLFWSAILIIFLKGTIGFW